MINYVQSLFRYYRLPPPAKLVHKRDRKGIRFADPGPERVIEEGVKWLCRAQDSSPLNDGGVSRSYSLRDGWATSYPETTGYIIPTLIDYAIEHGRMDVLERSRRMLDWLVDIQFPAGGFQGGKIDAKIHVPVTFNTGQILLGLSAGVRQFGDKYREPAVKAATWLLETQDSDGCWRKFATPFAEPGEKVYETHVSWGLFEAERVIPGAGYGDAGLKQVDWALEKQHENGWLDLCCLNRPEQPLTHTLGYALRGVLEAHLLSERSDLLEAAVRTAEGLLGTMNEEGFMPGRLNSDWTPAASWACLTGTVQVAHCWLLLYQLTGDRKFLIGGRLANRFVRTTIDIECENTAQRGAVKGSFPVYGEYGQYEYLNWAAKFAVDSNRLELQLAE